MNKLFLSKQKSRLLTSLLGCLSVFCINSSAQTTVTFNYTGAAQSWTVPPCVTQITVDVRGARGGNSNAGTGGNGARVQATIAVTPGQVLQINVGGVGGPATAGWNGGGAGQNGPAPGGNSGGGGGASDIRLTPYALANRIVVAGGGGGAAGGTSPGSGGGGGCATGVAGTGSPFTITGGTGGTQMAGGTGGPPWFPGVPQAVYGNPGALGQGGAGGFWYDGSGGGGGGGYYGGGGGGSDGCCSGGNGGGGAGGGSSLTPGGGTCTQSNNNGAGLVTITYTPGLPVITATNTGPYCEGATINLSSTAGGTAYAWSGPNAYNSNVQNPTIPGSTTAMGGVYTVTVTGTPGCTQTATTTVVVNPNPVPAPTNTGPYCEGNTIQLNSPTGLPNDDWAGPNGYAAADQQNPTLASSTTAMSGVYTVTITNGFNCSATGTTTVVVNANPIASASNTGPYCEGDTMEVNSSGGTDYDWVGPSGFILNNIQGGTFPNAVMGMNGTYTVTVTDANNCFSTATTTVVVNALPVPTANNTGPYCEGEAVNLTSSGGGTYAWVGPQSYTSTDQNPVLDPSTVAMSGTYSVTVTSAAGCVSSASTTIEVTAIPIPVATNNGPYCEFEQAELFSTAGTSYAWAGPSNFGSIIQNPVIQSAAPANSGVYTVTVTDGDGCSGTATTTLVVYPHPNAVPQFNPQNPTTLNPEVDFYNSSSTNIVTWQWSIAGTSYSTPEFLHTFPGPGTYDSYLIVTNEWGCMDTTAFSVIVEAETAIYIPNTFTPNGDGLNEIFSVYGENWARMELIIFDRWGRELFYSTDPAKGWNGKRDNIGELIMEGTYAYKVFIIDFYGKEHTRMGHINLIR